MAASPQSKSTGNGPLIDFSGSAKDYISQVIKSKDLEGHNLRISLRGRGAEGFDYGMTFAGPGQERQDDVVVDYGAFKLLLDPDTVRAIHGASINYSEDGGFQIDNPNLLSTDPRARVIQELLTTQINPAIAAHGGVADLVDIRGNTVYLKLGGGCQGCGMVDVTLRQGIEVLIKETLPDIEEVVDTTDHESGTDPYYQPAKK